MSKFSKIINEFLAALTVQSFQGTVVALVVTASSYLGAIGLSAGIAILREYQWPLFVALFLLLVGLLAVARRNARRRTRAQFPPIEPSFQIVQRGIYYEYLSLNKMLYKRNYKLKALRNGLNCFSDRYRWTGDGPIKLTCTTPNHQIVPRPKTSVFDEFDIRFPVHLKAGEQISTEVMWELEDPSAKAVPFMSLTIQEPTDFVSLKLKLPASFGVQEVICEHAPVLGATVPFDTDTLRINPDGCFLWEIAEPKLFHHYQMRWYNPTA